MDRSEKPDIVLVDDKDDDNEKGAGVVRTVDTFRVLGLTNEDAEFYSNVSIEQRKRIIRKVYSPHFIRKETYRIDNMLVTNRWTCVSFLC